MGVRERRWGCFEPLERRLALSGATHECRLADLDDSGAVDAADLAIVASNYGLATPQFTHGDLNGDAAVGVGDLPVIKRHWGNSCEPASIRFAAFGDYGNDSPEEAAVANLVKSWNPDFIITLGDNNYGIGAAETIDANIGKYYQEFIGNYSGAYGSGSPTNRFFPSLGNHDWWYPGEGSIAPYLDYFDLPGAGFENSSGNERYYDFVWGPVHFFAVNSSGFETNGRTATSDQADWLSEALAASTARWQVVFFHESPYSSGSDSGSTTAMQWPFAARGADLVLSAHDHNYERLFVGGLTYLVAGTGGAALRVMNPLVPGSQVTYNEYHGALLIEADGDSLRAEFRSVADGETLIDCVALGNDQCPGDSPPAEPIAAANAVVAIRAADQRFVDQRAVGERSSVTARRLRAQPPQTEQLRMPDRRVVDSIASGLGTKRLAEQTYRTRVIRRDPAADL